MEEEKKQQPKAVFEQNIKTDKPLKRLIKKKRHKLH